MICLNEKILIGFGGYCENCISYQNINFDDNSYIDSICLAERIYYESKQGFL